MLRGDEMIAVDGGRHRDARAPGLRELQHAALAEHVLEHHAVRTQGEMAAARHELLLLRLIEMSEQHLLGEGQRPGEAAAHHREARLHRGIELLDACFRHLDGRHGPSPVAALPSAGIALSSPAIHNMAEAVSISIRYGTLEAG